MSPRELIRRAAAKDVTTLALTDHDTIDGIIEAGNEAKHSELCLIPGIELSLGFQGREIHLLGYCIDYSQNSFLKALKRAQDVRFYRNMIILEKMNKNGLNVEYPDIQAFSDGNYPGRPHFAKYLVSKNQARSVSEAFDRFLSPGKPYYEPKKHLPLEEGIQLIRNAGGICMVAHPLSLNVSYSKLQMFMATWKEMGIQGIEAYYYDYSPGKTRRLLTMAESLELLVSAGSDFHGKNKPGAELGRVGKNHKIEQEMITAFLKEISNSPMMKTR